MFRKGQQKEEETPINELKKMKDKFNTIKPKIKSLRCPQDADEMNFVSQSLDSTEVKKEINPENNEETNKAKSKNIYQVKKRVDYEILHGIIRTEG